MQRGGLRRNPLLTRNLSPAERRNFDDDTLSSVFRNGLSTDDMLTLYQYLVQTLLPKQVEKEIQGGAVAAAQRHGRFISPPEGIRSEEDLLKLPKVYFMREDDTEAKQYYLVIYRTLSATVCFTVDGKFLEFSSNFRSSLKTDLEKMNNILRVIQHTPDSLLSSRWFSSIA